MHERSCLRDSPALCTDAGIIVQHDAFEGSMPLACLWCVTGTRVIRIIVHTKFPSLTLLILISRPWGSQMIMEKDNLLLHILLHSQHLLVHQILDSNMKYWNISHPSQSLLFTPFLPILTLFSTKNLINSFCLTQKSPFTWFRTWPLEENCTIWVMVQEKSPAG